MSNAARTQGPVAPVADGADACADVCCRMDQCDMCLAACGAWASGIDLALLARGPRCLRIPWGTSKMFPWWLKNDSIFEVWPEPSTAHMCTTKSKAKIELKMI